MNGTGDRNTSWARAARTAAAVAVLYACLAGCGRPGEADLKALAKGEMAKLVVAPTPKPAPPAAFEGPDGAPQTLAAFKGKVAVVNLWATWCAPCVKEMPTLAALQAAYAGKPVVVAPVSLDRDKDTAKARAFIAARPPLQYRHAAYDWAFKFDPPVTGFPVTIVYDRQGRERARLEGGADWTGTEARAVIDALLAEPS
jgi:thiol-disulfide isomerase/thioredoxin